MYAIKRKERVVDAVRRIARERLDRALIVMEPMEGEIEWARVSREARQTLSLLEVVGPAMDLTALRRERAALRRVRRVYGGQTVSKKQQQTLMALLKEVRMRAGYWHVEEASEGDGFASLRPGLMRVVGGARRRVRAAAELPDDHSLWPALIASLQTRSDALRLVQRCWPDLLGAERARVSGLLETLDEESNDASAALREASVWMSETPRRWCHRVGGYWSAWRANQS